MKNILSVLSAFLVTLIATFSAHTQPFSSGELPRLAEAIGIGEIKIPATKVAITLAIITSATDATTALQNNATASEKVLQSLKGHSDVSDIVTDTIQLYERKRYDNVKNESITTGYESRNQISFSAALNTAGGIIDQSIKHGANSVVSVSPKAETAALEAARFEAIALATKKAKENAEKSLSALGLVAKEVVMVRVDPDSYSFPEPRPFAQALAMDTEGRSMKAATPIEGGTNSVSARVLVRIAY